VWDSVPCVVLAGHGLPRVAPLFLALALQSSLLVGASSRRSCGLFCLPTSDHLILSVAVPGPLVFFVSISGMVRGSTCRVLVGPYGPSCCVWISLLFLSAFNQISSVSFYFLLHPSCIPGVCPPHGGRGGQLAVPMEARRQRSSASACGVKNLGVRNRQGTSATACGANICVSGGADLRLRELASGVDMERVRLRVERATVCQVVPTCGSGVELQGQLSSFASAWVIGLLLLEPRVVLSSLGLSSHNARI